MNTCKGPLITCQFSSQEPVQMFVQSRSANPVGNTCKSSSSSEWNFLWVAKVSSWCSPLVDVCAVDDIRIKFFQESCRVWSREEPSLKSCCIFSETRAASFPLYTSIACSCTWSTGIAANQLFVFGYYPITSCEHRQRRLFFRCTRNVWLRRF